MSKIEILVCCHKKDIMAKGEPYLPIQVGKSRSTIDLRIQGDNSGDNISDKNISYCELTGMYWAWKNLNDADVIGLCHYRRYFDFHNQCKIGFPFTTFNSKQFSQLDLSIPARIVDDVQNGKIVLAAPTSFCTSIASEYEHRHISDDLRTLKDVINETQPEAIKHAFEYVMYKNNRLSACNMFLMNKKDYNNYCSWLFPLLEIVEKRIDISHYNPTQVRIFGYMAERLLNVWINANKKDIIYKPLIWVYDDENPLGKYTRITYKVRELYNDLVFGLLRLKQ